MKVSIESRGTTGVKGEATRYTREPFERGKRVRPRSRGELERLTEVELYLEVPWRAKRKRFEGDRSSAMLMKTSLSLPVAKVCLLKNSSGSMKNSQ